MTKVQPLKAKMGEVKYRQKLVKQHQGLKLYFKSTSNSDDVLKWLKGRVDASDKIFSKLKNNFQLSPYLEIGAEKCQRAALLESKFKARGFALDISFESLNSATFFLPKLKLNKIPLRICADANNLPILNNSIPFIYCFQTLHHFPDPKPIIREIKRVLKPGGVFYFGEEPVKQHFNLNLWRRDFHLHWWEKLLKGLLILPFLSTIGESEVKYGALEEMFDLSTWEKALNIFDEVEISLSPFPEFFKYQIKKSTIKQNWLKLPFFYNLILKILGGGINGIAKKNPIGIDKNINIESNNLYNLLACPNCKKRLKISGRNSSTVSCLHCRKNYPLKQEVLFLLTDSLGKKLYPDID